MRRLLLLAVLLTAACAGRIAPSLPELTSQLARGTAAATGPTLYAFTSLQTPLVASYTLPASGTVSPKTVIVGSATHLTSGTSNSGGVAVAGNTIYVLDGVRSQLLVFASDATGNVAPLRAAFLPRGMYSGIALDGNGNFWSAEWNSRTMQRFSLAGRGWLKPSVTIAPQLDTPIGMLRAATTTVAWHGSDLYCVCVVLNGGRQAIGVTEYRVTPSGKSTLVKSYYDFLGPALPELPPSMMHVDERSGDVYAAGVLPFYGVFAWYAGQKSGSVHKRLKTIYGTSTGLANIESLTTDDHGWLYVATPQGIEVFNPEANGNVKPDRVISDPKHLRYTNGQFGDYLTIQ
jgi:hypothetical protein